MGRSCVAADKCGKRQVINHAPGVVSQIAEPVSIGVRAVLRETAAVWLGPEIASYACAANYVCSRAVLGYVEIIGFVVVQRVSAAL